MRGAPAFQFWTRQRRKLTAMLAAMLLLVTTSGCEEARKCDAGLIPHITSPATATMAENSTEVMTVTATDPEGLPVTYKVGLGPDAGQFTIHPTSGVLSFKTAPDFDIAGDANGDNIYEVDVRVSDCGTTTTLPVQVTVTDVNEPPTIINGNMVRIFENRLEILDIVATDPEGDTITYARVPTGDGVRFRVAQTTGKLSFFDGPADFENPLDQNGDNIYEFQVAAFDDVNRALHSFTIEVVDRNEPPVWGSQITANPRTPENRIEVDVFTATRGVIDPLVATDPEGSGIVYSIVGGQDQDKLVVDPVTGFLSFINAPDFDFPLDSGRNNVYDITLRASESPGPLFVDRNMGIRIIDQPGDAPPAPVATMLPAIKQLLFSWNLVGSADHYRILENPDGQSAFTIVPGQSRILGTSQAVDVAVHTTDWANARYLVESCNGLPVPVCRASNQISLTLGNMVTATGYLKASNPEAGDGFGTTVAISADGLVMAVGAPAEASADTGIDAVGIDNSAPGAGAVYLFRNVAGSWVPNGYFKADNTGAGDGFGSALALSADGAALAVGAPFEDSAATGTTNTAGTGVDDNAPDAGAVYLFRFDGTNWNQRAYIKASNTNAGDRFGSAVALRADGNGLAVGAPGEASAATGVGGLETDNSAAGAGAVYLYTDTGGTWNQLGYAKAFNTDAGDGFGSAVGFNADGTTLAVGAPGEDSAETGTAGTGADNTAPDAGAVYLFGFNGTVWSQTAYLKPFNTDGGDGFGTGLSLSDTATTLLVGAPGEDSADTGINAPGTDNTAIDAGAAYLFGFNGTSWAQTAYLKADNTDPGDRFGQTVSAAGNGLSVAIAAPGEDGGNSGTVSLGTDNAATDAGAAYFFGFNGTVWTQRSYVKSANTNGGDGFGSAVSLSTDGTTLAVGADGEDGASSGVGGNKGDNNAIDAGAAYLY